MAVDYSPPPWLRFDPAERINQAIQSSRTAKERESQQGFNQDEALKQDEVESEQRRITAQNTADQFTRQQAYKKALSDIVANPDKFPPGSPQFQQAVIMAGLQGGMVSGGAMGQAYKGLAPSKPAATALPPRGAIPVPTDAWGSPVPNASGEPSVPDVKPPIPGGIGPPAPVLSMTDFNNRINAAGLPVAPAALAAPPPLWRDEPLNGVPGQRNTKTNQWMSKGKAKSLDKDKGFQTLMAARDAALRVANEHQGENDEVEKAQAFQAANEAVENYAKARGITIPKLDPFPESETAAKAITATNPKTGEKIQFTDGKWQPIPQQ